LAVHPSVCPPWVISIQSPGPTPSAAVGVGAEVSCGDAKVVVVDAVVVVVDPTVVVVEPAVVEVVVVP
jgi:hypothetical protein